MERGLIVSRSRGIATAVAVVVLIALFMVLPRYCHREPVRAVAPHPLNYASTLSLGDAVVTGFSGTVAPDAARPLPANKTAIDQTFIDVAAASARIFDPKHPGFVWDGRYWAAPHRRDVPASATGQVFGVVIDDAASPNVYFAATSVYGLNLVTPDSDRDGMPERVRKGQANASWMAGQFGPGGGPGSIWKMDGHTGTVSLFATVTLGGNASGPPSLGNLAYDSAHKQLFVSDLYTGMIHRFDLNGRDLGHYDHGTTGRAAAGLDGVSYSGGAPSIASDAFDTENPATWGFAPAERRVWGMAVHGDAEHGVRLYYAVADGHIWSVGLTRDGDFASDPRLEIVLPGGGKEPPVSDIVFTHDGRMIVAERAVVGTTYDYKARPATAPAHVYRFWPEKPDDPNTPSHWYQQPEEYAVGFPGDSRNSAGGIALGYGYKSDGTIDRDGCEDAIYFTGDMLRDFHQTQDGFTPGGALQLYGLQVSPSGPCADSMCRPISAIS